MIDHLGLGRLAVLLVAALLVFGPERLPEIASQLGRALRQVRGHLDNMSAEVRSSIGPEFADLDVASLHPKAMLANLMADDEPIEVVETAPPMPSFELPQGTDAMSLLEDPGVGQLIAPWDAAVPDAAPSTGSQLEAAS